MSFIHLHVHSHYSLLKASSTIPDLVNKCAEFKMPSVALTDYGNMFGILEFYFKAMDKGINPIIGCEPYYLDDNTKKDKNINFRDPGRSCKTLVLLAKNQKAYNNLCCINTEANQKGFYFIPRADYAIFEKYQEDVIALTGGKQGRVPWLFFNKGKDSALKEIEILHKIFKSNFYLQLIHPSVSSAQSYNEFLAEVSKEKSLSLIAGGDVHYVEKKDAVTQDVLFCIGINRTLYDKERPRLGPSEFYFKNSEEMRGISSLDYYKEACDNTLKVSEQCQVRFKVKDSNGRPIYHLPQLKNSEKSLKELAYKGLEARFEEAELRGEGVSDQKKEEYKKRIQYELDIIDKMGFNGYFYIVYDFINWAKKNNIPVGPGRGSGASSLMSFCLRITDLDPIPLNLIFERFLNPERISMPDFDIDFCQENRHRVIDYISQKYGSDCSSHVITYGRLNVRAAIRDVGRVLGLSYEDVDSIAKMIPNVLGITLKAALKKEPKIEQMSEEDPKIKELIELTALLEGLVRHVGIHAAGIIIADNPIVNYAPLYRGADGENVIQYDLEYAEKIGLIKFDFLGLKALTHIAETFRLIEKNTGKKITAQHISLSDPGIYEVMSQGDTIGIFQFEGDGITDLLIKSQPTCFEDIIAINALYRPGPMNMIPSYLERKKAKVPVDYIFPELEPILKETYGIIVYQEQVQQIAVKIAGYSYGEADVLRRAMGKKIQSVMKKQKERFLKGAEAKKYSLKKSEELFNLMAEFAKYGFNKSHAAAYCVLAAQTAWLKKYYPIEFLASQMTIDQNDSDKLVKPIQDAKAHHFEVMSPHINSSFPYFSIRDGKIPFSLGAIKGIGLSSAQEIARARESLKSKKFSSIEEFFEVVDKKRINRKTLESLVKSGCFDGFSYNRKELLENLDKFTHQAENISRDKQAGQQSLFSGELKVENKVKIKKMKDWNQKERSDFEKEVFGFYLNNHPSKTLESLQSSLNFQKISNLKKISGSVKVLGMFTNLKEVTTKKGQRMAFAVLEDSSSGIESILFPDVYEKVRELILKDGEFFCVSGQVRKNRNSLSQIIIEKLILLDDFLKSVERIEIQLNPQLNSNQLLDLKKLIADSRPGASKVCLQTYIPEEKIFAEIDTQNQHGIEITHDFLQKSQSILKNSKSIQLHCSIKR